MSHGKETREYKSVRKNLRTINDHLRVNQGARQSLTEEYEEKEWIGIAYNPAVSEFTGLALNRIENDASQYHIFMDMLRNIKGIDIVVSRIEATYEGQGVDSIYIQQKFEAVQTRTKACFRRAKCLNRMFTKYERILSNEEREAAEANAFGIFQTYWNFLDYSLLKHSIKEFGTSELQSEMKMYIAALEKFMQSTLFKDYDSPPPHFPEHFIIMTITQNKDPTECTLYEVCQFKKELVKQSDEHAILTKKSRSVEIAFALAFPPHALTKIYGVFNADFQEKHKIMNVTFSWRSQQIRCVPLTPSNVMREREKWWGGIGSGSLADCLYIPKSKQEEIRQKFTDEVEQKKQSLSYWINTDPLASWMRLDQMTQGQLADSPQLTLTDPSLTPHNLILALESLPDMQWKVFGKMIEMPESTLERLESQFHTAGERKAELLRVYVTEHRKPTWKHVSDVLYRMRDEECHTMLDILQSNVHLMRWQMGRTILNEL